MSSRATFGTLSDSRKNNFDVLRFFLASLVIYSHSCDLLGRAGDEWFSRMIGWQMSAGGLAVECFFILSGFLVAKSWVQSGGLMDYLRKRALRIMPGYTMAIVFCVFIVGPVACTSVTSYFSNPGTYSFLRMIVLGGSEGLPGTFSSNPVAGNVNGSLWTIRHEVICYLLLASVGLAGLFRKRLCGLALFVVTFAVWAAQTRGWLRLPGPLGPTPRLFTCFTAGMAFFVWRDRLVYSGVIALIALIACVVGSRGGLSYIIPFAVTYLLFYVAYNQSVGLSEFARHGDFSYGMYLYAFPVQQLLIHYGQSWLNPWLLTAIAFVGTLCLAMLSWRFVEEPFLRRRRQKARIDGPSRQREAEVGLSAAVSS